MNENPVFSPVQRLTRLLSIDKKDISQVYVYAFFNGLVNLSLPLGIQAIINLIQGGEPSTAWIILVGIVITGIAAGGLFQLMQLRIVENISQRTFCRSSFELAVRLPRIRFSELYRYYAPELANRFFDTISIQKGLPKILIDFSLAIFQIVAGLILLSLYHPFFILFGIILLVLVYGIIAITGPRGLKTSLSESKYKYEVAHWLQEIARTKMSFKVAADPGVALDKMDQKVSAYLNMREGHFRILIRQFLYLIGFKVFIAAGLLLIGGFLVFEQEMNIGQFVAAEIIILLVINSMEKVIQTLDVVYDMLTALEKIGSVTDMKLDVEKGLLLPHPEDGIQISVENLNFTYPDAKLPVLQDISFEVSAGESLCIKGENGSGKSTLVHLLAGILEPDSGVIQYNGLSIGSIEHDSFRKHLGFVLDDGEIFSGTLLENITLGRPGVKTADVLQAMQLVNLDSYLSQLPEGLYTELDPGGQRIPSLVVKKILLARALVTRPEILIIIDPFKNSDQEREEIISKLLDRNQSWRVLVVTNDSIWQKYISRTLYLTRGNLKSDRH